MVVPVSSTPNFASSNFFWKIFVLKEGPKNLTKISQIFDGHTRNFWTFWPHKCYNNTSESYFFQRMVNFSLCKCSLIDKLLLGLIEWIRQMKEVHKTQLLLRREQFKNIFLSVSLSDDIMEFVRFGERNLICDEFFGN